MSVTLSMTIAAGQSLSDPLQVGLLTAVRIGMPPAWDPAAPLTFAISPDGVAYLDLCHVVETSTGMWQPFDTGISMVIPNTVVLLPPGVGLNLPWLKLRSGTRSKPINQSADRTFALMFG